MASTQTPAPARQLLIVVDGLRPDYVTPEVMPNLSALGRRGVVFARHHAVYPTVTRVNASSISTGAYPEGHGLLGNSVFFPRVDAARFLDTSDRSALMKIAAAEGRLLTAPTLGELLQASGRKMLVVSSGSAGSALLNNHSVSGGAILHPQFTLPESLAAELKAIGPVPNGNAPPGALDRYAVDAFLTVGLKQDPSVTVLWLGALDATAHEKGIGAPDTQAILKHVDSEIGRIEAAFKNAGLFERYNIWVTSDHGFSTYTGGVDVAAIVRPFAAKMPDGSPRIVASGGAIYVRDGDQGVIAALVAKLQATPGVGAIFTRAAPPGAPDARTLRVGVEAGSWSGGVPGTLSFEAVRWTHDRAAQILFSPDWSDAANAHGFRGRTASTGIAGHGSTSPWDIHNPLIAAGPDLKRGLTLQSPSANTDFAPTFLRLFGIQSPPTMHGRPLTEALAREGALPSGAVKTTEYSATSPSGDYTVTAMFSIVSVGGRDYRYFDGTRVARPSR